MSTGKDVTYKTLHARELKLDLYRPAGIDIPTRTAVVLIHGGGWIVGDRQMVEPLAKAFANQGFLAIGVEYRLVREAPWPAQLDDVTAAINWVAENADTLGVDAGRIVVAGASAGGHLALMAAVEKSTPVAAVLSLFSASDLCVDKTPAQGQFNATALVGPEASSEAVRAISPIHQISRGYPPVYVLHGSDDWVIDPSASVRLYEKLRYLGVTAELNIVGKALHEFVSEPGMTAPIVSEMALFLDRVLINPQQWEAETAANNMFSQGPEALPAIMKKLLEQ